MQDKKLKKLRRTELLELLLEERRINENLEKELAETRAELESKHIRIENSGNLAEAALALTEVFDEAQKAADLYLENARSHFEETVQKEVEERLKGTQPAGSEDSEPDTETEEI